MGRFGAALLRRRDGEVDTAWMRSNLQGPETLVVSSPQFNEGGTIPLQCVSERIGGENKSPALFWTPPPSETKSVVLVVEDPDIPLGKPFVHCLALVDPTRLEPEHSLALGALSSTSPPHGVHILRPTMGDGYRSPEPPKGSGQHRYMFQLFALSDHVFRGGAESALDRQKPRDLLASLNATVVARGRLTGMFGR